MKVSPEKASGVFFYNGEDYFGAPMQGPVRQAEPEKAVEHRYGAERVRVRLSVYPRGATKL
jgi:hypothetical protein